MALFDYLCEQCKKRFEVFFMPKEKPAKHQTCPRCSGKGSKLPGFAGYNGNTGPASVKPKNAGSFKRK